MTQTDTNSAKSTLEQQQGHDGKPSVSNTSQAEQTKSASDPAMDASQSIANDAARAPEEESQSEIPGDPRPPHQTQPPTKEQF